MKNVTKLLSEKSYLLKLRTIFIIFDFFIGNPTRRRSEFHDMMSKHLQLYHAACADRPIITPQKF